MRGLENNMNTEKQRKRKNLRAEKISARNALSSQEREKKSEAIVNRILDTCEFQHAQKIMIYKGYKGEVRLKALEESMHDTERVIAYPLCISDHEMIALVPGADTASWTEGYHGITEPVREKSAELSPEELDLVICPCTAFDEQGGRMGQGGGFYDRYLEKCINAKIMLVAFECQKADSVLPESWDRNVDLAVTEDCIYRF